MFFGSNYTHNSFKTNVVILKIMNSKVQHLSTFRSFHFSFLIMLFMFVFIINLMCALVLFGLIFFLKLESRSKLETFFIYLE